MKRKMKMIELSSSASLLQNENGSIYEYLKSYCQIPAELDFHFHQVYFALYCAVVASVVGMYLDTLLNIGGFSTYFFSLWSMFTLGFTPLHQEETRVSLLMSAAMFGGVSIGHMIKAGFHVEEPEQVFLAASIGPAMVSLQSMLVSAFVGWNLAFGCFLGAAMLARRREYLYWGGLVSSGVFLLHFTFSICGGVTFCEFDLYFGVFAPLGFILEHTLVIFTDFAVVYWRLFVTLPKNEKNDQTKKEEKRLKQETMPKNEKNGQRKKEEQRMCITN